MWEDIKPYPAEHLQTLRNHRMVHSLIPTLPKCWKESKCLRNDVQNPPSSTTTCSKRQSTKESQQWDRAPEKSSYHSGNLGVEKSPFLREAPIAVPLSQSGLWCWDPGSGGTPCAAEEQVVPWHKHRSSSCCTGQKGLCDTAQPAGWQHNGHRKTDSIWLNKIIFIYTCGAIMTNKIWSNFLSFYHYLAKGRNYLRCCAFISDYW